MKKIQIVSIRKTGNNTCEVKGFNLKNASDPGYNNARYAQRTVGEVDPPDELKIFYGFVRNVNPENPGPLQIQTATIEWRAPLPLSLDELKPENLSGKENYDGTWSSLEITVTDKGSFYPAEPIGDISLPVYMVVYTG